MIRTVLCVIRLYHNHYERLDVSSAHCWVLVVTQHTDKFVFKLHLTHMHMYANTYVRIYECACMCTERVKG